MSYLIQRNDGKFVSRAGSQHSYTKNWQDARIFPTRQAAESEKCGNEHITPVHEIIQSKYC